MEYLLIYLLQIADVVVPATIVLASVVFIICLIIGIIFRTENSLEFEYLEKYNGIMETWDCIKKLIITSFVILFCCMFIPTKQTLLLMGGVYYGKKVVTSEIGQKAYKIIDLQLDKYIKELTDGNKENN